VHYVQRTHEESSLLLPLSFSACESRSGSNDVLGVEERREVNILASQDAGDHSVVKVEAVPDASVIVASVELGWVPGCVDFASRVEDGDVAVFTKVFKLEQTGLNGLDAQRIGDCGGFGGSPRLDGHGKTSHLLVVDGVVDLRAEQAGLDTTLDEVIDAQRNVIVGETGQ
jgi:hypothetical protein